VSELVLASIKGSCRLTLFRVLRAQLATRGSRPRLSCARVALS
jgi:hypothetical protein